MKTPLLLSEIVYFILSLGNSIALLLIENSTIQTIILCSISIGMLVIWFMIKIVYYRFETQSTVLLFIIFFIIVTRTFALVGVEQQTIKFTDIFKNSDHRFKYIPAILITILLTILDFDYYKILQSISIIFLIVQKNSSSLRRKTSETPRRYLKASLTWNQKNELPENTSHLPPLNKIILSQPNMHHTHLDINEEILDSLQKVSNLFNFPYVITDEDVKPILSNTLFQEVLGIRDNKNAQYNLVSIKIKKIDKIMENYLRIRLNQNQDYFKQQSLANTQQIRSISSCRFKFQLLQILKYMDSEQHCSCQILDFESEFFPSQYQIDIRHFTGYFLFVFVKVQERDDYNNKTNSRILMNQLFRSLSHEFSTSLNCIQILAENAVEELPKETVDKYIQPLLNSSYILNSVVQDVKDFSLILSKSFTLSIKKTKISTLVNDVTSLFVNQIEMKGLTITKYSDEITIHTDGQRVKQALINLVQNAQKFTFKGSIIITAKMEIIRDVKYYKFCVQDTGPGMSIETQEKILKFLKSKQKQRLRDKTQSYGLGLLITDNITKGLCPTTEGGIHIESKQNVGSQIWFYVQDLTSQDFFENYNNSKQTIRYKQTNTLRSNSKFDLSFPSPSNREFQKSYSPRCFFKVVNGSYNPIFHQIQSDFSSENLSYCEENLEFIPSPYVMKEAFKKPLQQQLETSQQLCKILIVDDEYVNIYALKIMLTRLKYICDVANNGEEGFEKYKIIQPQIVFMDIEMPIMNGITATKLIRQYCSAHQIEQPTIIAQTAYTDSGTKAICNEAGMDYFLQKPIHSNEIIEILQNSVI